MVKLQALDVILLG